MYLFLYILATSATEAELVDRVAAVVENSVVTERELEEKARMGLSSLADIFETSEREKRRKEIMRQALDEIIADKLIDSELSKLRDKLGVTDAQVERAYDETAKANRMDKEQLTQVLYNQGMTVAEFKQQLRKEMERTQYLQIRMQGKSGFTEKDIEAKCAEHKALQSNELLVHAKHILVKVAADASDAEVKTAKARAESIFDRLKKGTPFADLVDKESDDKGTPGGDLGYFKKGVMLGPFEQVAFSQPVGQVAKPVRTSIGFHIVLVEDRKRATAVGCEEEEVKTGVMRELQDRELKRQMRVWIDELKRKAFIDVKI
jgi:peptidyl-prolyl cis-trans isomerase SurA